MKKYCPQIDLVAIVATVATAFNAINIFHPDIMFMDIQLSGETGFDLLKKLGEVQFEIIFTTSYESYMLKAIKLSAIDYLLKPVDGYELKAAVKKQRRERICFPILHILLIQSSFSS